LLLSSKAEAGADKIRIEGGLHNLGFPLLGIFRQLVADCGLE
jgi:hypothetical protein